MTDHAVTFSRRFLLGTFGAALLLPRRALHAADGTTIEVYKSPSCGCCHLWVEHLEANGFAPKVQDMDDLSQVKMIAGVPEQLSACHTALVDGFVIEGHVPAAAIDRLLAERPDIQGLAVPGMPAGSPGMPDPNPERYDVYAFRQGEAQVFMSFIETEVV
ncbi:MAG: DUF411 domain-containing protein [Alphaproteobacteria bacterium]|nr:DUF411 domain-containing protein [Alphaproteobacteria bacterium]